jgi:hypothetical protein
MGEQLINLPFQNSAEFSAENINNVHSSSNGNNTQISTQISTQIKTRRAPIIILDWDDTIMATTYYQHMTNGLDPLPSELVQTRMQDLGHSIESLFCAIRTHVPTIYIVTNACCAWIEFCWQYCLPRWAYLANHCTVISTVDHGYNKNSDWTVWKREAFLGKIASLITEKLSNIKTLPLSPEEFHNIPLTPPLQEPITSVDILAIGDAHHDRSAALALKEKFGSSITVKSIQLQLYPTLYDLIDQHNTLRQLLPHFLQHNDDIDLRLNSLSEVRVNLSPRGRNSPSGEFKFVQGQFSTTRSVVNPISNQIKYRKEIETRIETRTDGDLGEEMDIFQFDD